VYIGIGILVLLVVSIGGFYAYDARSPSTITTTTSSSSSTSSSQSSSGSGDYAVLDTSQGTIVIQLLPQAAPQTVANFISLANSGFYNDLVWHRIVAGFVIQTGDPNTKGAVNSTRDTWGQGNGPNTVPLETNPNYLNNAGYVGLARGSSTNSGSSQFYINLANNTSLNGSYTVFGQVVSGMNVVEAIAALQVYTNQSTYTYDQPVNAQQAILISVTIQSSP
jgi:cyclophilin family peptidyl-prolyl cis-trans isomerase